MIKLLVPDMPTADQLMPYLRRIDESKVYVNQGQLVQELEAKLQRINGVPCAVVSNGTLALELSLRALYPDIDDDWIAVMPAMTFCATGLAAKNAGLQVKLLDVDESTWQLSDDIFSEWRSSDLRAQVGVVMPVASFGMSVDVAQWENYNYKYPVVIDAAGAFDDQKVSQDQNIITCFSLHATKFIGCGEGGIVASSNSKIIAKVKSLASFGEGGTNAKMSEYHAAVALASLDLHFVLRKQARTQQIANWYAEESRRLPRSLRTSEYSSDSTMLNVLLPIPAAEVIKGMADAGIETKQWYRPYLDERADFTANGKLPVTDHLRKHLIGLPFHNFLTQSDIAHVCDTLKRILLCA